MSSVSVIDLWQCISRECSIRVCLVYPPHPPMFVKAEPACTIGVMIKQIKCVGVLHHVVVWLLLLKRILYDLVSLFDLLRNFLYWLLYNTFSYPGLHARFIQSICCKLLCSTLPHLPQFLLQFYHLRRQIKVINFAMGSCYIFRLVIVAFFVSVIIIVRLLFSVLYNVKLNEVCLHVVLFVILLVRTTLTHTYT